MLEPQCPPLDRRDQMSIKDLAVEGGAGAGLEAER